MNFTEHIIDRDVISQFNEMIDEREYAKIEKKRAQFGESVVKQNKLFKGGDLTWLKTEW